MNINLSTYKNYKTPAFAKIPVKIYGEVSPAFVKEIKTGISQYPRPVLQQIQKADLLDDIRIAPKLSEAIPEFPELQNKYKNEFAPGTSFKIDDCFNATAAEIPIENGNQTKFLNFVSFNDLNSPVFFKTNKGAVGHELSHKASKLTKKHIGLEIALTKSFKEVVTKDLKELPERLKLYKKLYKKWGQ